MQFKNYYKDILSIVGAVLLLGTTILINKYDVKQLYREFATLTLKVNAQEKEIKSLEDRVNVLVVQNQRLITDLEKHNKTRGSENALLLERLYDLEQKVEILSSKPLVSMTNGKVFNDRFEFTDKQVNRVGQYETKGQVLVAWKDDYLATKKVNVNTIGEINLSPKIKKLDKDKFISYIRNKFVFVKFFYLWRQINFTDCINIDFFSCQIIIFPSNQYLSFGFILTHTIYLFVCKFKSIIKDFTISHRH